MNVAAVNDHFLCFLNVTFQTVGIAPRYQILQFTLIYLVAMLLHTDEGFIVRIFEAMVLADTAVNCQAITCIY